MTRDMILTARMQARLSTAAYYGKTAVENLAKSVQAKPRFYDIANVSAAALMFHDHTHLSIVGSNDRYDWAINTNTKIKPVHGTSDILGHAGFIDAAHWIAREIQDNDLPHNRLYIGGHSAGGAIAEILPLLHLSPEGTYSFGAPKWCASKSAAKYWGQPWRSHRFIMSYDPVPYTPFSIRRKFRHVAIGIDIKDNGDYTFESEFGYLRKVTTILATAYAGSIAMLAKSLLHSHSSMRYAVALENASKEKLP